MIVHEESARQSNKARMVRVDEDEESIARIVLFVSGR